MSHILKVVLSLARKQLRALDRNGILSMLSHFAPEVSLICRFSSVLSRQGRFAELGLNGPHLHEDATFCADSSDRIHVVQRETRKNTAIERFVNPPDNTAPNGAGVLSTTGESNISTAGFANAVHLGYHVFRYRRCKILSTTAGA